MTWGRKRHTGHIRAWQSAGAISFRVDGGAATSLGLPGEAADVALHFRLRGLSFRCEAQVREVQRESGRLMVVPSVTEWRVGRLAVEGAGRQPLRAHLTLLGTRGRVHRKPVVSIGEGGIGFVCWPCPKQLHGVLQVPAWLVVEGQGRVELNLRVHRASPIFQGSQGRILTGEPLGDNPALNLMLQELRGAQRSVA